MRPQGEDPASVVRQAFGTTRQRGRWSWGHRAFVFALTLTLCLAIFVLVLIAKARDHAPVCIPNTPALARVPAGELRSLRAELARVIAVGGPRPDTAGYGTADDVWAA